MFRVLKDHCGLLRWENTSKYMYEGHFELPARQVCLFLTAEASYSFFSPHIYHQDLPTVLHPNREQHSTNIWSIVEIILNP